MSWLFSRALVEEFSAASSSAGEPCAQLNVMPTPHKFWRNDKTMDVSNLSRFGLTCAVLTESRGAELLTWYLAGFPARTFQPQEKEPELTASAADYGANSPGSLARYDPDSRSWKTAQFSLLGGLESFSETWPRWGLMRNGACSARTVSVPLTNASGYGLWPTPTTDAANRSTKYAQGGTPLSLAVSMWATPCTPNGGRSNKPADVAAKGLRADGRKVQVSLESQAKSWQTPKANDAEKRGDFDASNPRNGLAGQVKARGTPTARDHKDCGDCSNVPENGLLGRMAKTWSGTTALSGSLSAEFHLWLLGWPTGWTALEPLATGNLQSWLQQHSASSPALSEAA